ncbi:hypothetical protein CH360_02930 [Leptospira perolatii]|nr:hypothetical protein CH360_02930 [Leptospira perolatii]
MSCGHCVKTIDALLKQEGISGAANLEGKFVELESIDDVSRLDKLKDLLKEEGYELGGPIG